jgi:glycosyltransferase involved in cell wall biosynthesis
MINDLILATDQDRFALTVATDLKPPVAFKDVSVSRLPMPPIRHNPLNIFSAGYRLAALARDFDLVMTTTARTHPIGAVAAKLSGTPLIWRLADDTFPMGLARALSSIPKRIIAISSFIAGRYSPDPSKTIVLSDGLPNGAPITSASRQQARAALGLADSETVALIVARLVRWKGHSVFVQAVNAAGLTGLVVGGEDTSTGELGGLGLKAELEKLGGRIHFLGHRSDLATLFAAADIFVHASTRPEPFGRSLVQAMLAGLPVIATRAGAIPEVVGHAGRLVPAGHVPALVAALQMDAATRTRLGHEARARALENFELTPITRRLEAIWAEAATVL